MIKTYDELYEKLKAENVQPYDEVYKLYVWEYPGKGSEDIPGTLVAYAKNIHDARDSIIAAYADYYFMFHITDQWQYQLDHPENMTFDPVFKMLLETDPNIYYNVNKGIFRYPGQMV